VDLYQHSPTRTHGVKLKLFQNRATAPIASYTTFLYVVDKNHEMFFRLQIHSPKKKCFILTNLTQLSVNTNKLPIFLAPAALTSGWEDGLASVMLWTLLASAKIEPRFLRIRSLHCSATQAKIPHIIKCIKVKYNHHYKRP
jgi:hypothetical protein